MQYDEKTIREALRYVSAMEALVRAELRMLVEARKEIEFKLLIALEEKAFEVKK